MPLPTAIGYLVPEFPSQTHAFFWRERQAIEESGITVRLFSTRKPAPEACPHAFGPTALEETTYLFPLKPGRVAAFLAAHPAAAARALRYVGGLHETPLPRRMMLAAIIGSAVELVLACREAGISHVHIHSCANAAHLGALAHILDGLDYSLTLHGDLKIYGTDHPTKMARAQFVSAVTTPLQTALRTEIDPQGHFPVIWMGVDVKRFAPDPARRAGRPADRFEVVSAARLNFTKGHRFFLRAMAQLRAEGLSIYYRLAGEGPEREAIEAEIATLGLGDYVEMLGAVSEEEILHLLQSSDALALTSILQGEAAPVAVMEAMACGLPPICSIIGGTPDMIEDGVDGFLVAQEDIAAIADATRELASDPARCKAMGDAARATALRLFDHRTNALTLYREIARAEQPS